MSLRALAGLAIYNVLLLGIGSALLWGVGGWRWWTDLLRLAGVAYLLGVAAIMVVLTLELVVGVPITLATGVVSGTAVFLAGVGLGLRRGCSRPALPPHGWRVPGISVVAALFISAIAVFLEALFRGGRLASIRLEWDGWAFWVPKAKAIYSFGELDPEFLLAVPTWTASYPPGLPALHGLAFHAMGAADSVTLHLQYWFYAVGFVTAVVGLLAGRVRQAILFPLLLVALVMPSLVYQWISINADVPLAHLVAVAALLVVLWVVERQTWQLVSATALLSGAILTKREGILLVACVLLAGFAASVKERRALWPRLALAALGAVALTLPWRIWFTTQGLPSDGPTRRLSGQLRPPRTRLAGLRARRRYVRGQRPVAGRPDRRRCGTRSCPRREGVAALGFHSSVRGLGTPGGFVGDLGEHGVVVRAGQRRQPDRPPARHADARARGAHPAPPGRRVDG